MARRQRRRRGSGGLTQRPDGRWHATKNVPEDGTGRPTLIHGYGYSESDAEADLARKVKQRDAMHTALVDPNISVSDWLETWIKDKTTAEKPLAYKSVRAYRQGAVLVNQRVGTIRVRDLSVRQVRTAIAEISRESGRPSARNAHAVLRNCLGDAEIEGLIPKHSNPLDSVEAPSPERDVPEPWTLAEVRSFLRAIEGHPLRAMFLIAALRGPRPGENLGLTWANVGPECSALSIIDGLVTPKRSDGDPYIGPTKTGRKGARTFALAPYVAQAMRDHRADQDKRRAAMGDDYIDNDLVFCHKDGTPLRGDSVSHSFSRLIAKAGLPHIRLYDLRRVATALLSAATRSTNEVRATMGWTTDAMIPRYSYTMIESSRSGAEATEDFVLGQGRGRLRLADSQSDSQSTGQEAHSEGTD